jgi:DNA-binding MarR family transcriptional regulator
MWMTQQAIFGSASDSLEPLGLNPKSMAVLAVCEVMPYPHDIARSLGAPFPTISNILRELERLGYVERSLDKNDRRKIRIERTALGTQKHDEAVQAINVASERVLGKLTDQRRLELQAILAELTAEIHGNLSKGNC